MPEYLAPGVYVEEVTFGSKTIDGVSTTATDLIGFTSYRPGDLPYAVIRSPAEFELRVPALARVRPIDEYVHTAVRTFFEEGGKQLYVAHVQCAATDGVTIDQSFVAHAERTRYRITILDSAEGQYVSGVHAASEVLLDERWVRILEPVCGSEVFVPPNGAVAGIYVRSDAGAAAKIAEMAHLVVSIGQLLHRAQEVARKSDRTIRFGFFERRSLHLWGAHTTHADPEWKYVSVRRFFAYLERAFDEATQWVVFEPNTEVLWTKVRSTVEDLLHTEWTNGALCGDKPEEAYFVRCDRSTMTQDDLDNGRLVCLVGVAVLRPAEFVIFRIGQWTADKTK